MRSYYGRGLSEWAKRLREMLEGVEMADSCGKPRALFLFPSSNPLPDDEICSGQLPTRLKGKPCPYSDQGRIPFHDPFDTGKSLQMNREDPSHSEAASCSLQNLGMLEDWVKEYPLIFPKGMGHKILYKCRQMFFVIFIG
jgi:hypothetical protein